MDAFMYTSVCYKCLAAQSFMEARAMINKFLLNRKA